MSVAACGTFVVSRGFFTWATGALQSGCKALNYSVAHRILVPRSGIDPVSPELQGRFLTVGPPGQSLDSTSNLSTQHCLKDPSVVWTISHVLILTYVSLKWIYFWKFSLHFGRFSDLRNVLCIWMSTHSLIRCHLMIRIQVLYSYFFCLLSYFGFIVFKMFQWNANIVNMKKLIVR